MRGSRCSRGKSMPRAPMSAPRRLLAAAFFFLHAALGALAALFDLPRQALRWRTQQKERAISASMLDGYSHLLAGRFLRARKAAELALAQERSLEAGGQKLGNAP